MLQVISILAINQQELLLDINHEVVPEALVQMTKQVLYGTYYVGSLTEYLKKHLYLQQIIVIRFWESKLCGCYNKFQPVFVLKTGFLLVLFRLTFLQKTATFV